MIKFYTFVFALLLFFGCNSGRRELGELDPGVSMILEQNDEGDWGISLFRDGKTFVHALYPLHVEISNGERVITRFNKGFDEYSTNNGIIKTRGSVEYDEALFHFRDTWEIVDSVIRLNREVEVEGNLEGGFMTGVQFRYSEPVSRDSIKIFAPGMIYGSTDYLPSDAIGGSSCKDFIRIREDRLPAPLFGAYFSDGFSISVLNSQPDSRTTKEDSRDNDASTLIDERFRFGAIGADFRSTRSELGYWFPGSEGGITYKGRVHKGGRIQKWSRRYHPVSEGLRQEYQVSFRIASDDSFRDYYSNAWRWAWATLEPGINMQEIEVARHSLIQMLAESIEDHNGVVGIRKFTPLPLGTKVPVPPRIVMGFTGASLQTADFLLVEAREQDNPIAEKHRNLGESIINTFLKLELAPPVGEGFYFDGKPALTRPLRTLPEPIVFLRSFGDGLKALMRAAKKEQDVAGKDHQDWISWAKTFADWLLPQQSADGGFPRAWKQGTGEVFDPSPNSSYAVISFLVLLAEITGDQQYAEAAAEAGEFCWNTYHKKGVFIGGTLDNPNVIDKEAGTISLEAYLMLYRMTDDDKWLERALAAAAFAETWIYIWNVPMPEDENDADLYWEKGTTTIGLQCISTGHSLTDMYMAYDVDEFADLYLQTGDKHYYDVAMILLHNTKAMLALPGRVFDQPGPGWMQEHWSLAPTRGIGMLRAWLPWVATSQLNGIIELKDLDPELYNKMINP